MSTAAKTPEKVARIVAQIQRWKEVFYKPLDCDVTITSAKYNNMENQVSIVLSYEQSGVTKKKQLLFHDSEIDNKLLDFDYSSKSEFVYPESNGKEGSPILKEWIAEKEKQGIADDNEKKFLNNQLTQDEISQLKNNKMETNGEIKLKIDLPPEENKTLYNIQTLRKHLFDMVTSLQNGTANAETAKAMASVAQTILNSAKIEMEYKKLIETSDNSIILFDGK